MLINAKQLVGMTREREKGFLSRLDALVFPHSASYAEQPQAHRLKTLSELAAQAREWGMREELNIGLFALLRTLFGQVTLSQPELMTILNDPDRSGAAKVYQLWDWHRRQFPHAPIFATEQDDPRLQARS